MTGRDSKVRTGVCIITEREIVKVRYVCVVTGRDSRGKTGVCVITERDSEGKICVCCDGEGQ